MSYDICPASDLITQGFGCTSFTSEWIAPWCPSKHYHSGIDLGMRVGSLYHQPVYATRAGQIVAVGVNGGDWGFWNYLGNQAVCLKAHDAYILYAHLDVASVTVGQMVQVGQQIGFVGSRGNSTGPHLHVEVRTDGAKQNVWQNAIAVLDPRPYLNDLAGGTAGSEVRVQEEDLTPEEHGVLMAMSANVARLYYVLGLEPSAPSPNSKSDRLDRIEAAIAAVKGGQGPAGPEGPPGPPGPAAIAGPFEATISPK